MGASSSKPPLYQNMWLEKSKKSVTFDHQIPIKSTKTVAVCKSYGGFELSSEAIQAIRFKIERISHAIVARNYGLTYNPNFNINTIPRDNAVLIEVINDLGIFASGNIFGIQMDIRTITFKFDPHTEFFGIYNYNGYEDIIIVNKNTKERFRVNDKGERISVTY